MSTVTEQDIKDAYRKIEEWPDWRYGRHWHVPIYSRPEALMSPPPQNYDPTMPTMPDSIPVATFRVEPAVNNETGQKVWLVYGQHGELKVLVEVMNRKS